MFERLTIIRARLSRRAAPDVFVLGNQKSGTTVIAAALAECAGVSAALDLHALHTRRMTAAYASRSLTVSDIVRRCGNRFRSSVVKEPILTFYMEELLESFPRSRYVFIVRDPRDNIRSILNRLRLPGDQERLTAAQWASVPAAWRESIENRRLGFSFSSYVEGLAHRWLYAWRLCSKVGDRVKMVRYEDFLADKVGFTRRLARQVGYLPRVDALRSVNKQYQDAGDRTVCWRQFFGENLPLINHICRSAMATLGYDLTRESGMSVVTPLDAVVV
jgi:Sulfotransferase family